MHSNLAKPNVEKMKLAFSNAIEPRTIAKMMLVKSTSVQNPHLYPNVMINADTLANAILFARRTRLLHSRFANTIVSILAEELAKRKQERLKQRLEDG